MGYYNDMSLSETHTTDDDWYDRKDYGRVVAPVAAVVSDQLIPRNCDIIARALDCRASAVRLRDDGAVRQLDRLIQNLPGARLCWQLGTLIIDSPSGGHYQVTRGGCSCPNGQKSHARQCWHVCLFELLLDMFETDCDSADDESLLDQAAVLIDQLDAIQGDSDFEADCDEMAPRAVLSLSKGEWRIGALFAARIVAARAVVWAVNWNS